MNPRTLLTLSGIILGLSFVAPTFAAVDRFEVVPEPTTTKVGEAIDVTIRALDKDGNVEEDYAGEILIFSEKDPQAEFPASLTSNTYKFKASDAGVVKFDSAVKFSKAGTLDINVYDTSDENIFGYADVTVADGAPTQNEDIAIKYPENGTTVGSDSFKVNGTTAKNHQVKIKVNGKKEFETISTAEGMFEVPLTGLETGKNTLKASVYDADGKVIGSSSDVIVTIDSNTPVFKSITTTPDKEVDAGAQLRIEVSATPGLASVTAVLNDFSIELKEGDPGVYSAKTTAPKEEGNFDIDVTLKNELGKETQKPKAKTITVTKVEMQAAEPEPQTVNCEDLKKNLDVKNLKVVKMKTKSILSWDKNPNASSYNVYKRDPAGMGMNLVQNVTESKLDINITGDQVVYDDFAVKAVLKNDVCDIEGNQSDMTKVQTGPKEVMMIILLSLFIGTIPFFVKRRKY